MSKLPIEDRIALQDLIAAYSWALDTGDADSLVECFTEDCVMSEEVFEDPDIWEARGIGVVVHQAADALVAFPDVGVFEDFLAHHAIFGEAGDEAVGIAGVERPAVGGDQVLQGKAVFDGKLGQDILLQLPQP